MPLSAKKTPKQSLDEFVRKFSPAVATIARGALTRMRKLLPGAQELVYDNYNALAIAFAPSERASEAIMSVALYPRWVSIFFAHGKSLPDPTKRLRGSGGRMRHIVLESAADLDAKDVRALVTHARERAKVPLEANAKRKIVIKSISAKQRPRRPLLARGRAT